MIDLQIQRCKIHDHFTKEQQQLYFDRKKQKVTNHIDTLYYTISLVENEDTQELIDNLVSDLEDLKQQKQNNPESIITYHDLTFSSIHFSIYEYCLSFEENYDIFISKYIPNESTPRVVVQLRTRSLVLLGVEESIYKSYFAIQSILSSHSIDISEVKENRIDYAYHTNCIQNTGKYFNDNMLLNHLKSKLKLYQKVGNIGKEITIDYMSLGNRKSNNVFFRIYNKSREVIEKNYKSFFYDIWLKNGLISNYDFWCYNSI